MDLLARRLGNAEVADKFFISTTAVKGRLRNICGKLKVSKRREAVNKTEGLGILNRR
jgi:ATP/maltotriose-dependent transcriptional regulator MalT